MPVFADAMSKILIGQDNGILTVASEVVSPRSDGPMMTKTKLGWIIHGVVVDNTLHVTVK
jgi:hypothetical protein